MAKGSEVLGRAGRPTDMLLFIDTRRDYEQLTEELRRHAGRVRRYIVLYDTATSAAHPSTVTSLPVR